MEQNKNLTEAIDVLENAKREVEVLLSGTPSLHLRTTTTIDRLINGLKVVNGMAVVPSSVNSVAPARKPLTKILGRTIKATKPSEVKKPSKNEVEHLREAATTLYGTFLDRDNKEILDAASDQELRAVARLAGMRHVTSTVPATVGPKFLDEIKEAIREKARIDMQKHDLLKADTAKSPETKTTESTQTRADGDSDGANTKTDTK